MKAVQKGKILGEGGSFQNQLMSHNATLPVVGEYCINLLYSDRIAYRVAEVSKDRLKCKVRRCKVEVLDFYAEVYKEVGLEDQVIELSFRSGNWYILGEEVVLTKEMEKLANENGKEYKRIMRESGAWKDGHVNPFVVEGVTRVRKTRTKVNVVFQSSCNYRQDPSF